MLCYKLKPILILENENRLKKLYNDLLNMNVFQFLTEQLSYLKGFSIFIHLNLDQNTIVIYHRPILKRQEIHMKKQSHLGALIKEYRLKAGMTQLELATKLNYSIPQFISLMENGHSKIPLNVLGKIIPILSIPEKKAIDLLVEIYRAEAKSTISDNKKKAV